MKRILGMPDASCDPRDPLGTPLGPPGTHDAPGTPGHAAGTPRDAPGTPRDVPETPRGRSWDPRGPPGTPMGPLMDHKNNHISTNRQRQKLSIAVFEPARQGPSHEAFDLSVFFIKRPPKSKQLPPGPGIPYLR